MSILRALGLGKDPHIEWMTEEFGAKPVEIVVNRLYEGFPKSWRWEGSVNGIPLSFYTGASSKFRGGSGVYLGKAGPQFMKGINEYHGMLYLPKETATLTIDDPRWPELVKKAVGNPDWGEAFPEEAFEAGIGMGRFTLNPDCPFDPPAIFPLLGRLREHADALSDAVERVGLYPGGVGIGFVIERLTRERMLADVALGCRMLSVLG